MLFLNFNGEKKMSIIHPLEYELKYGKQIAKNITGTKPSFIILTNHNYHDINKKNVFPFAAKIMHKNGIKFAEDAIVCHEIDSLKCYLEHQDANVILFPNLIISEETQLQSMAKLIYSLGYSVISCVPSVYDKLSDKKRALTKIGFDVIVIHEENLTAASLISPSDPSKEAEDLFKSIKPIYSLILEPKKEKEKNPTKKEDCWKMEVKKKVDGIYKVLDDYEKKLAYNFSMKACSESGWDSALVHPEFFDDGIVAYYYVKEGEPVGYVAFSEEKFVEGTYYALLEVYTKPENRNNGIASNLIDHGIDELKIDKDNFFVYVPITNLSKNIILKRINKTVYTVYDHNNLLSKLTKKEFEDHLSKKNAHFFTYSKT